MQVASPKFETERYQQKWNALKFSHFFYHFNNLHALFV